MCIIIMDACDVATAAPAADDAADDTDADAAPSCEKTAGA
jgi:hypothetical protein